MPAYLHASYSWFIDATLSKIIDPQRLFISFLFRYSKVVEVNSYSERP